MTKTIRHVVRRELCLSRRGLLAAGASLALWGLPAEARRSPARAIRAC